jgi:hypothetical protein
MFGPIFARLEIFNGGTRIISSTILSWWSSEGCSCLMGTIYLYTNQAKNYYISTRDGAMHYVALKLKTTIEHKRKSRSILLLAAGLAGRSK